VDISSNPDTLKCKIYKINFFAILRDPFIIFSYKITFHGNTKIHMYVYVQVRTRPDQEVFDAFGLFVYVNFNILLKFKETISLIPQRTLHTKRSDSQMYHSAKCFENSRLRNFTLNTVRVKTNITCFQGDS